MGLHFLRTCLRRSFVAFAATACSLAAQAVPLAALEWSAQTDAATAMVHFDVKFDRVFDVEAGDSFQFWVATDRDPMASVYDVLFGRKPLGTERVFEFRRAAGQMDVVAIRTLDWWQQHANDPNASRGGWGEIIGSSPYADPGDELVLDVPMALLGIGDERFFYQFETYEQGASSGVTYWAGSGSVWTPETPVPQPPSGVLMAVGLTCLSGWSRRRGRCC